MLYGKMQGRKNDVR